MTEAEAREILGDWITGQGHLYHHRLVAPGSDRIDTWVSWPVGGPPHAGKAVAEVALQGFFTARQLEALAWWMQQGWGGDGAGG